MTSQRESGSDAYWRHDLGSANPLYMSRGRIDRESGDDIAVRGGVREINRFIGLRRHVGYGPIVIAVLQQNRGGDDFDVPGLRFLLCTRAKSENLSSW